VGLGRNYCVGCAFWGEMRGLGVLRVWCLAAGLVLLWSGWAAASVSGSGWSVQRIPNPRSSRSGLLLGVSCIRARGCIAVGASQGRVVRVLAERWDGRVWTILGTPLPKGAGYSLLDGVSCTFARVCTAVGYYYADRFGTRSRGLVERWDGRRWAIQGTPHPPSMPDITLSGVSCPSRRSCIVVGTYRPHRSNARLQALVERWNGRKWTIQQIPNPAGASNTDFYGVSCTSSSACTAVGSTPSRYGDMTLAERWNGRNWTIQPTPNPPQPGSALQAVSCTSPTACTAVGGPSEEDGAGAAFAEHWDGTRWTIQPTPEPTRPYEALSGVSCASAKACTAVGQSVNDKSQVPLAARWNGSRWTIQHTPRPRTSHKTTYWALNAVSCPSHRQCTAIGTLRKILRVAHYSTLAERWKR
jgi:uncharacterized membrane protein